jgi:hypothetical protein
LSFLNIEVNIGIERSFSKHIRVGHWFEGFAEPDAGTLKSGHVEVDFMSFDESGGRDDTVGTYFSTAECYKVVSGVFLVVA